MTLAPAPESQPSGTGAELIGRDKIVVGDLTNTYAAIGAGASLIVHKARSRTGEIRREERLIEERLADALEVRLDRYRRAADAPPSAPRSTPTAPSKAMRSRTRPTSMAARLTSTTCGAISISRSRCCAPNRARAKARC